MPNNIEDPKLDKNIISQISMIRQLRELENEIIEKMHKDTKYDISYINSLVKDKSISNDISTPKLKLYNTYENSYSVSVEQQVDGGHLVATMSDTGVSKEAGLMYYPEGTSLVDAIDLALAEVKEGELLPDLTSAKDIDLYLFDNPFDEDFTRKSHIKHEEITEALDISQTI